jgi:hypothetical protein
VSATSTAAARLTGLAEGIGAEGWADDARRLAADDAPSQPISAPTHHDIARGGLDLVRALVAEGDWEEADRQAAHLVRHFRAVGSQLHAVAWGAFDGLRAAVQAHDEAEVEDFGELVEELFPEPNGDG